MIIQQMKVHHHYAHWIAKRHNKNQFDNKLYLRNNENKKIMESRKETIKK